MWLHAWEAPRWTTRTEKAGALRCSSGNLPTDNDADAIAHALWDLTYRGYREAVQAFLKVKTQTQVNAKEEDTSADFTPQTPSAYLETKELPPPADQHVLEAMVAKYSAAFRGYPYIYSSSVLLTVQTARTYFVSTEGSQVVSNSAIVRAAVRRKRAPTMAWN